MSPTIFRVKGYRFYFLSNEEKRVHVHVISEKGEAKYWLEPKVSLANNFGLNQFELKEIREIIKERENDINEAWKRHFS